MGELHLEVLVDRMMREFGVAANVGKPQVAYRETITEPGRKVEERYIRQTGGRGQYGHVVIDLEPTGPGGGYEFVDKITGGVIPGSTSRRSTPASRRRWKAGVLAGYPIVDVRAILTYGSYHDVDSSEMAFKIAGSMAFKEGGPEGQAGPARADHGGRGRHPRGLHGRRHRRPVLPPGKGRGHGASAATPRWSGLRCRWPRCSAMLPTFVRGTQGRATYTMQFHSYQQVPESIAREIVARVRGE